MNQKGTWSRKENIQFIQQLWHLNNLRNLWRFDLVKDLSLKFSNLSTRANNISSPSNKYFLDGYLKFSCWYQALWLKLINPKAVWFLWIFYSTFLLEHGIESSQMKIKRLQFWGWHDFNNSCVRITLINFTENKTTSMG